MPLIGSAMMSVCVLAFMLAANLAITHSARERAFTLTHGLEIVVAGLVTLVAGIYGTYPRGRSSVFGRVTDNDLK